eukprot:CAMPEP_0119558176 /NCGR_PEP_ID=MMETSP1352-20130426/10266_1 /TAXON_ID=265584 /ORGANISM="Stauroneis constricta, Strain CCMP1120" /LENGTH=538 /DNA_ID=CAMNT_0007605451 /DNA_START=169 /DNA_END=1785 /DNA_ORIENTATION=-
MKLVVLTEVLVMALLMAAVGTDGARRSLRTSVAAAQTTPVGKKKKQAIASSVAVSSIRRPVKRSIKKTLRAAMTAECYSNMKRRRRPNKFMIENTMSCPGSDNSEMIIFAERKNKVMGAAVYGCDGEITNMVCKRPCESDADCAGGDKQCYESEIPGYKICGPYAKEGELCNGMTATVIGALPNKCHPTNSICFPKDGGSPKPPTIATLPAPVVVTESNSLGGDTGGNLDGSVQPGGGSPIDNGSINLEENPGAGAPGSGNEDDMVHDIIYFDEGDGGGRRKLLSIAYEPPMFLPIGGEGTCRTICDDNIPCEDDNTWCRTTNYVPIEATAGAGLTIDGDMYNTEYVAPEQFLFDCVPYLPLGGRCGLPSMPHRQEKCDERVATCVSEGMSMLGSGGRCRQKCNPPGASSVDATLPADCPTGELCSAEGVCYPTCDTDAECVVYNGPVEPETLDVPSGISEAETAAVAPKASDKYWCRMNEQQTTGLCVSRVDMGQPCVAETESSETPWLDDKCTDFLECNNDGKCDYPMYNEVVALP